jgi:hypothetical protein
MNSSSQHILFAELADMAERGVSDEFSGKTSAAHISTCGLCSGALDELKRVMSVMRADDSEDVPREVLAHAIGIFRRRTEASEPSLLRKVIAALSFDSFSLAPAFGVRSGPVASRQLLYSAEGTDIDLRVSAEGGDCHLSGQVLGPNCAGGFVELRNEEGRIFSAVLGDLCEFALPPMPPGTYKLRLRLANAEVEAPDLDLRA